LIARSARTSSTVMLSWRREFNGSTLIVPLKIAPAAAAGPVPTEIWRAKLAPAWWRTSGDTRMPSGASYVPDSLKSQRVVS